MVKSTMGLRVSGVMAILTTVVLFAATPAVNAQTYNILYFFGGHIGAGPVGNLIMDAFGNLYGVTNYGGSTNNGIVYKLNSTGTVIRTHNFRGGADGGTPYGGVIRDGVGNLYGTTSRGGIFGGICGSAGCGVVYKLDTSAEETMLYAFTGGADDWFPLSAPVRDSAGNLYGTAEFGGRFDGNCGSVGCGVVYKVDPQGSETILHAFTGQPDGRYPFFALVHDSIGNLYGVTPSGGRG